MKVAILVDGGFYRKRSSYLYGHKTPQSRANELNAYCFSHLKDIHDGTSEKTLYRIFYYDCPPISKAVWHPLLQKNIHFNKQETYAWTLSFFNELKRRRKFALRLGVLSDEGAGYTLNIDTIKKLCSNKISVEDLTEKDFHINFEQKGVDMRIGIDIASLSYKKQVEQIVLISGDSDFVPAAKLARREGIDFILDPMGATIKDDLFEHIDGLRSPWKKRLHPTDKCRR